MSNKRKDKLTLKQRAYVKNLTDTNKNLTQEQAAILAGYSPKSASSISSELMGKTKIIKALEKKGLTDDFLADSLKTNIQEGTGVKATASDSIKATELVMKLKGHLGKDTDVTNNTQNNYIIELSTLSEEELEERYNALQEVVGTTIKDK